MDTSVPAQRSDREATKGSPAQSGPDAIKPLRSVLNGPIGELSLLRQSLLFAELSNAAYLDEDDVARLVEPIKLHLTMEFFDRDGAQAYRLENETDIVIACRGTEPHDTNDVKADIDVVKVVAETVGHVHRGFKSEVDELWPMIEKSIRNNTTKTVWFCGHSLGGAMATICAYRCFRSGIASMPEALFTYGSPRVGTRPYLKHTRINHIRWVNNNDIVPRMPPAWFGFRHCGREMYLNRNGRLRRLKYWGKAHDRLRGFFRTLLRFRIDHLSDHLMDAYIDAIDGVCQRAEAAGHPDAHAPRQSPRLPR